MSNSVSLFENVEFGSVRSVDFNGEPWFVAIDIAKILEYSDTQAMTRRLDDDEVMTDKLSGMNMNSTFINESGLYNAIIGSKKPDAKRFKKWITSEVLPSIRKNGGYIMKQEEMTPEQIVASALIVAHNIINAQKLELEKKTQELVEATNEIIYKEDVIIGLVKDISLAEKRQRLNQIMRHNFKSGSSMQDRWNILYAEFEQKFHCSISRRMKSAPPVKPKIKSKLDFIDRNMNMLSDLYELAVKIFENDIEELIQEWRDAI